MAYLTEDDLEQWTIGELKSLGFEHLHGSQASPDMPEGDRLRESYRDVILLPNLKAALKRLNPDLPGHVIEEVVGKIRDTVFADDLLSENARIHEMMKTGVPVTWIEGPEEKSDVARILDWDPKNNEWLAVNQYEVTGKSQRRPDIVLFVNGLPLVVIELKGTGSGTLDGAFNQIETYKNQIPELFRTTLLNVISEGVTARFGSLSANFDRFMRWRTVDGDTLVNEKDDLALSTMIHGLLNPEVLLEILRWFTVFENEGGGAIKKVAGYHQFHAVKKGVRAVLNAKGRDTRGGVVWHTQGSGKSILMAFFGGMLMHDAHMENPTLVVLTDRNDLDNQLFATFARCANLLGEDPQQADGAAELREMLNRQVGGVFFTTIQKFRPAKGELEIGTISDRSNVVIFVDEAHRSQYGFDAKLNQGTGETRYGFAHALREALPNAVHVAFTGTPINLVGADTLAVFGEYIDIYDISQAVEDGATVPIHYEGRVAKVNVADDFEDVVDGEFEEIIEEAEDAGAEIGDEGKKSIARKWSRLEALVGSDVRLDSVVEDILQHFDARIEAIDGKAMIVCMSRRICVEVYNRIVAARPDWHSDDDGAGAVKVVMTGNATDPAEFQRHIRTKPRQEVLRNRARDPNDPLRIVIVRDMWLTGFDAPCMHTLYVDKPMKGHGLMQAIARVNRVFKNKPSGLVVDYIGLAADLKKALAYYSDSDRDQTGVDQSVAVGELMTRLDVMRSMFHGIDYMSTLSAAPMDKLQILTVAIDHALELEAEEADRRDSKRRFMTAANNLIKAFKIASGTKEARSVAEEVGFFVAVRSAIQKMEASSSKGKAISDVDLSISQLVNRVVTSTEVVDILAACGMQRPDISVLDEEFLLGIQNIKERNIAVEALQKLLNDEIKLRTRTNVVKREEFSDRLRSAIAHYHNRSVDALEVIQELIELARALSDQPEDGMTEEEAAFYDALSKVENADMLMKNEDLRILAAELVRTVRSNSTVDWYRKRNVQAKMRMSVKKILRKFKFPPDLQNDAVKLVLRQAEALAQEIKR